uniref:Uncharacterized protein n=1 Tax=Ditylum brightwellii TaxID=49249 RepID=A0A7S4QJZ4_9STRA
MMHSQLLHVCPYHRVLKITAWLLNFTPLPASFFWPGVLLPSILISFLTGGAKFLLFDTQVCQGRLWSPVGDEMSFSTAESCSLSTSGHCAIAAACVNFLCVLLVCLKAPVKRDLRPDYGRDTKGFMDIEGDTQGLRSDERIFSEDMRNMRNMRDFLSKQRLDVPEEEFMRKHSVFNHNQLDGEEFTDEVDIEKQLNSTDLPEIMMTPKSYNVGDMLYPMKSPSLSSLHSAQSSRSKRSRSESRRSSQSSKKKERAQSVMIKHGSDNDSLSSSVKPSQSMMTKPTASSDTDSSIHSVKSVKSARSVLKRSQSDNDSIPSVKSHKSARSARKRAQSDTDSIPSVKSHKSARSAPILDADRRHSAALVKQGGKIVARYPDQLDFEMRIERDDTVIRYPEYLNITHKTSNERKSKFIQMNTIQSHQSLDSYSSDEDDQGENDSRTEKRDDLTRKIEDQRGSEERTPVSPVKEEETNVGPHSTYEKENNSTDPTKFEKVPPTMCKIPLDRQQQEKSTHSITDISDITATPPTLKTRKQYQEEEELEEEEEEENQEEREIPNDELIDKCVSDLKKSFGGVFEGDEFPYKAY